MFSKAARGLALCALICVPAIPLTQAYNDRQCCEDANNTGVLFTRNSTGGFLPLHVPYTTCGQQYNVTLDPAVPVFVKHSFCKSHSDGIQFSSTDNLGTWAAPLVQFILPSIIFSMSIPRQTTLVPRWSPGSGWLSAVAAPAMALITAFDTLWWVGAIMTLAGPLMMSGLREALLDYRILHAMQSTTISQSLVSGDSLRLKLLVAAVCGNFELPDHHLGHPPDFPDPRQEVTAALQRTAQPGARRERLLNLMRAQGDFGVSVGAPVVFYLGGFAYTILDLLSNPSSEDGAISLAFGVEWMIIVHVAIISGCLLASNNPSAASNLVDEIPYDRPAPQFARTPMYETRYQPVSMFERGANKRKWMKLITMHGNNADENKILDALNQQVHLGWRAHLFWIIVPTIVLISLPPGAGAVVARQTPPVGWACRSLTLMGYAGSQLFLIPMHELRQHLKTRSNRPKFELMTRKAWVQPLLQRLSCLDWIVYRTVIQSTYILVCGFSAFFALGGTLLQIMGVYKNCICYTTADYWSRLSTAYVEVASDTSDQRNSSVNWLTMGSFATIFMAACSYLGWWYQKRIRVKYGQVVNGLG